MLYRNRPIVRVWQPTESDVSAAVREYFTKAPSAFYVVRSQVAGKAVALALQTKWSPALAKLVRAALTKLGGKPIVFNHAQLFAGVMPRHFDDAQAVALSMELRGRKNPPKSGVRA